MAALGEVSHGSRAARALVLALCVALFLWNALHFHGYLVDDAFISLRYARNLVEGHGLVYNPGERVEGFSNPTWVGIAAAALALGLPVLLVLEGLGLASGVAVVLMTSALARRAFATRGGSPRGVTLATWLVAASSALALWSVAGLETAFFAALLLGAVLAYERELEAEDRAPWSALLFGLAWASRPEAPAYALYFLARRLAERRAPGRRDLRWLALLAVIVVPYELLGWLYYGRLLPNTYAAKIGDEGWRAFSALFAGRGRNAIVARFALDQGFAFTLLLVAGIAGLVAGLARRARLPAAVWAPSLAGLAFALYAWLDWMPRLRLLVPALPFLMVAVALGVDELLRLTERTSRARTIGLVACATLAAAYGAEQLFAGFPGRHAPGSPDAFATRARGTELFTPPDLGPPRYPLEADAWFLLEAVPEDELVALPDIGFPGYLAGNPIFDVRGLVTPSVTRARSSDTPEARATMIAELLAARPAYVALPLRPEGPSRYVRWFDDALQEGEGVGLVYERMEDARSGKILYVRRDLEAFDVEARVRAALERFPEYDSERARAARAR